MVDAVRHGSRTARFAIAVGIAVACCLGAAANASPRDQADAITSALRARDYDKAVELTREALKASPNDPQIWTLQGIALSRKGDTSGALAAYRRALTLSPDYIPALEGAAQLQYQAGSRDAVPLLTHLLQLRPTDPTTHAMLAVLEYREGKCETAVGHFEKTGTLLDSELDALHAYGTCLVRLKQRDEAIAVFQRAVALRPDDARERRLLASIQLMASKPRDAIDTLSPNPRRRRSRSGDAGARGQRLRGCRRHRARGEHAASGDSPGSAESKPVRGFCKHRLRAPVVPGRDRRRHRRHRPAAAGRTAVPRPWRVVRAAGRVRQGRSRLREGERARPQPVAELGRPGACRRRGQRSRSRARDGAAKARAQAG